MVGAPCGSADVFATAWVFCGSCFAAGGSADGVSAGNRSSALPPGLSTGLALGRYGRLPAVSGATSMLPGAVGPAEFAAAGLAAGLGAVTDVVADACGSVVRPAALAVAVKRTEVTVVAEAATAIFACS